MTGGHLTGGSIAYMLHRSVRGQKGKVPAAQQSPWRPVDAKGLTTVMYLKPGREFSADTRN